MRQAETVAGFDYGTSHCSIALVPPRSRQAAVEIRMVPLEADQPLIASTLYAPKADFELTLGDQAVLDMASQSFRDLRFGAAALEAYLHDPTDGYFVKSPKSFLGAPGLSERVKDRFISVVAAMMANIRKWAEAFGTAAVDRVVIGRPVNFQGASGEAENQQALTMLVAAAREAGFAEIAFLYEPMAAAFDFESTLNDERLVLVVDIGGGTTDCSFVRVGPGRINARDREPDVLGHAGERLGGNDYDQALALKALMPDFGLGDRLTTGLPIANHYFVDAVSTNDVNAQQRFYSRDNGERFAEILRDAVHPDRFRRLARLRSGRGSYRLLRQAELGKIGLSADETVTVDLTFVDPTLSPAVTRGQLAESTERLLGHLGGLIDEVVRLAQTAPDAVYLTGGMARSAVVRSHLERMVGDVPLIDSDHFTSVTRGLALWADRVFTE